MAKISHVTAACLGPFIDFMGLLAILPLIVGFVEDRGDSQVWVGMIISAQYGAVVVGSQLFGYLSDLYGPKKVMTFCLFVDSGLFLATGLAKSTLALLFIRFCAGIFTPLPTGTAWIGIAVPLPNQPKAFHKQLLAILAGCTLGTAFPAAFGNIVYCGVATAVMAFAAGLVILFLAPDPYEGRSAAGRRKPQHLSKVYRSREFVGAACVGFHAGSEGGVIMGIMGVLYKEEWNYDERSIGVIFMIITAGLIFGNIVIMEFVNKHVKNPYNTLRFFFPIEWAVCAAIAVMLMPRIIILDIKVDYILCFLFVLQFCAQTPMFPAAMGIASEAAMVHGKDCVGTALGSMNSVLSIGQTWGPIVGTIIYRVSRPGVWLYLIGSGVLALSVNMRVFAMKQPTKVQPTVIVISSSGTTADDEKAKQALEIQAARRSSSLTI